MSNSKQQSLENVLVRLTSQVAGFEAVVRKDNPPMDGDERRALPKGRTQFDGVARDCLQVARDRGIQVPGVSYEAIDRALGESRNAELLLSACQGLLQAVTDLAMRHRSAVWRGSMDIYTTLQRLSRDDAALARRLEPITAVLSSRSSTAVARRALSRAERSATRAAERAAKAQRKAQELKSRVTSAAPVTPAPVDAAIEVVPSRANGANGANGTNGVNHA